MVRTEMHDKIMEAIKKHHDASGGKTGLPYVRLLRETGYGFEESKDVIMDLFHKKEYYCRKGLNDKLFFYGSKKKR